MTLQAEMPEIASVERRPKYGDKAVIEAAVPRIVKLIGPWMKQGESTDEEIEEVAGWIAKDTAFVRNGYELAKDIEDEFRISDIDEEFVDALGSVGYALSQALKEKTAEWIQRTGVKSPFVVGQKVRITAKGRICGKVGEVAEVREGEADLLVCVKSDGHVASGTGTHGYVVHYEDVEAA